MSAQSKIADLFSTLMPVRSDGSGSTRLGLQLLLLLRSFVTLSSVIGLLIFLPFTQLDLPIAIITTLIACIVLSVGLGFWRLTTTWVVSNIELFGHLLVDVAFLVILLVNTGGASNPLISYLLVLLAVAATLLPRKFAYTFAVGSIVLYSSFLLLDLNSNHSMGVMSQSGMDAEQATFQLHLIGMWVIFLVSAILISVFITRMAKAIQIRELNLAEARENEMRNEQLVAIGTLAAGTAHALGTPLSTMAVLLTELDKLDSQQLKDSDIKEDITLLKEQVTRCKNSLTQLTRYYNKDHPEIDETSSLSTFVNDIQDYIVNIHPHAPVNFIREPELDPVVPADPSFKHAVINIIENGIKAAKSKIDVAFRITDAQDKVFEITITDDGPGIPAEVLENMGEPFISMRKESMGLGIFLANASIQKLGGSIEMFNLKIGGAVTVIKLPIHKQ